MPERKLLVTISGEPFQPSRIHYELYNKVGLQKLFSALAFMKYDKTVDRWTWLYTGKAKKLTFKTPWKKIPRRFHPIIIGSFFQRTPGAMFLETRSIERAVEAIEFFDKIIPHRVAKVTDFSIVNRLFDVTPDIHGFKSPLDHLFANETKIDPEAKLNDLKNRIEAGRTPQLEPSAILKILEEESNEPPPEVERFPAHYYEDGITTLKFTLRTRQILALEHWKGNTGFSMQDIIGSIT